MQLKLYLHIIPNSKHFVSVSYFSFVKNVRKHTHASTHNELLSGVLMRLQDVFILSLIASMSLI